MYSTFPVERFGGLNLRDDPEEIGIAGAIDLLNVDLATKPGRVITRGGLAQFDTSGGSGAYSAAYPFSPTSGAVLLLTRISGTTITLDKMTDTTITNIGNWSSGSGTPFIYSFASIGTSTTTAVYIASRATTGSVVEINLRKYDGTTLAAATPASLPAYVASWKFRLVQAHFQAAGSSPSGANGSKHTVFFSDAGAPDTYTATSWIQLDPGDGDEIVGMAAYENDLYVVKNSHYYRFYGTSTQANGQVDFNFYKYSLPSRIVSSSTVLPPRNRVVAGPDGVYVIAAKGIYRIGPGGAQLVSLPIDPIFYGSGDMYLTVQPDGLFVANDRLFLIGETNLDSSPGRLFVYDFRDQQWVMWQTPNRPAYIVPWGHAGATSNDAPSTFMVVSDAHVYQLGLTNTTDYTNAIVSRYQSGFYSLGPSGADVFTRWTRLWGSGTPTVSILTDHGTSDAFANSVTLGTAPTIAEAYHGKGYGGKLFSHKLSATSGAWSVNRLQHDIDSVRA